MFSFLFYLLFLSTLLTVLESKLDIVFGRSQGSYDDDWTQGYQGNFYGAEIFANGETYAATWKFDGEEESIKIGDFPSSRSTGNFYVTYEKTPRGSYVTTMRLLRKLVAGDEGATGAERDHETVEHPVSHAPEPASLLGPARRTSSESAVIRVLFRDFF